MDTHLLSGTIAVVTGAGSGIGLAAAIRFAAEGATIVGCDISDERVSEAAAALDDAGHLASGAAWPARPTRSRSTA